MSLKSILKRMFNIKTKGVYRTFRILGVPCKYKSPKLRLLRKIDFVSKQNDTALESRLSKEIEVKIKTLADIREKLCDDFERKLNESEKISEHKIAEAKSNFDERINSLKIENEKQLSEFKSQIKKLTEENSEVKNDLELKNKILDDENKKLKKLLDEKTQNLIMQNSNLKIQIDTITKIQNEKLQNTTNDFNARNFLLQKTVSENLEFPVSHLSAFVLGNAGDNILVDALRKSIEQNAKTKINFIDQNVRNRLNNNDIYLLNQSKAVIVGGGGLFLCDTNRNDVSGWQFPISVVQINQITSPIILLGVGYNRFRGQEDFAPVFRENLNAIIRKACFVGIRNSGSIRALQNYLDDDLKNKLIFHPCATTILSKIYDIPESKSEAPFIAFECAFDRDHLRYGERQEIILNSIANVAAELSKEYKIKYYAHMESDKHILPYFDKRGIDYEVVPLMGPKSTDDFLHLYSAPRLVIGVRGHAQMIPFGCGTPILSVISHDKLACFLEDINHPEWGVDVLDDAFETKLFNTANSILKNEKQVKEQIKSSQETLFEITKQNILKVTEIMYG